MIIFFHFAFRVAWWKKADLTNELCLLENLSPPTVAARWMCGFRFKISSKSMNGNKDGREETLFGWKCLYNISGNRRYLVDNVSVVLEKLTESFIYTIVKVMSCCLRVLNLVLIQMSVAFLPQEEQSFALQEWGDFLFVEALGHTIRWYPKKRAPHMRRFRTLFIILNLIKWWFFRKNFHQLPLCNKMFLIYNTTYIFLRL